MQSQKDIWLSEIFSLPVFNVKSGGEGRLELPAPCFAYSKVGVDDIISMKKLSGFGFYVVDTNITFIAKGARDISLPSDIKVRKAEPKDECVVRAIAANSFTKTRFHADLAIDNKIANRIKEEWAGNYFSGGRGDEMLVAEKGGEVIGFNQILIRDDIAIIDLIAVATNAQGQGAGKAMIAELLKSHKRVRVGTQLANNGSIALYEKMGFTFENASYVLHYHAGQ